MTAEKKKFLVIVTPDPEDPRWILVFIPGIPELTQALSLNEAPGMARELIKLVTDLNPDEFTVEVRYEQPVGRPTQRRSADAWP